MVATINLSAISSKQLGAVIESGNYWHSNQCIQWCNLKFIIIPNKDHPSKPWVMIIVHIHLLKGMCEDESKKKLFFLYLEGDENHASCPIMALLSLALEDDIFMDVFTIEEILFPTVVPTQIHTLAMFGVKLELTVLRAEVRTPNGWLISATMALPNGAYLKFLRVFSREEGFPGVSYWPPSKQQTYSSPSSNLLLLSEMACRK